MNVSLTPELEEMIDAKVRSGMYQSASEVVREALRALVEREARQAKFDELKREIQLGIDDIEAGRVTEFDAEDTKARGRQRLLARRRKESA
jgi:antitoxin ParD1/3/4